MRASLLAGVLVCLVAFAGCGGSTPAPFIGKPGPIGAIRFAARTGWSPAVPRSATTPAEIAEAIASRAGFGKTIAVRVDHTAKGVGLTIHVPLDVSRWALAHGALYASWKASLIDGVVADAFAKRGIRLNKEVITTVGVLPNGKRVQLDGGIGDILSGQDFSNASDAAIKQRLADILRGAHLTPVSITVLRIGQPAPVVVIRSSHPHANEQVSGPVMTALFGYGNYRYEGFYIQINSPTGAPVVISTAAFRTGTSSGWSNSSLSNGPTGRVGPTGPVGPTG